MATYWLKLPIFPTPLSFGALAPHVALEFRGKVNREETRVIGLSSSEDCMVVAGVVLAWYQRMTDGQTVRQTVRQNLS